MAWLELDGRRVYYEEHGEGPLVILLHHGFSSCEMWRGLLPHLVMAGHRVVMYDRRGYGRSEAGDGFREFYFSDGFRPAAVEELAGFMAALELGPAHLVGQCEGGVVALDAAAARPELVKSLCAASTQCHSPYAMPQFNREKFPTPYAEVDPSVKNKMIKWQGEENAEERFELFRYMGGAYGCGDFDLRPLLPSVTAPALVLYPDRSALFPVEQGVAMYRGLPLGELAVIPSCGHNSYDNRPTEYLRILLGFLRRHEQGEGLPDNYSFSTCAG
ncbi:MAG: alpha/beta hydrolase [Desulfarculaceae bacterium]|nr:alpha/beta hydrolase [Desulfarculaceae bacterium]MCF8072570.1 alpha/beta hydrolase [Desulfarculaceae bacterium]MCF8103473.1 alpha/beta hydrolase [Desulfarculaceae bacterium]MCF8117509.1 alpha/beta hydrolase [Desulfarculaceae bacterium]